MESSNGSTSNFGSNEVGWDAPTASTGAGNGRKVERFSAKGGVTYRMAILTDRPVRTFSHFIKPYGYFACLKADGLECVACNAGTKVTEKYAANILLYPAGADATQPWDPSQLKVMLWQFGPKVKNDVAAIITEWGKLENYDLKFTCTNEQYQHMNVTPCRESLWRSNPYAQQIAGVIEEQKYELLKIVGRKESVEEVRTIWGTPGITREALKAARDRANGASSTPAAPAAFGNFGAPAQAAPAAYTPTSTPAAAFPASPAPAFGNFGGAAPSASPTPAGFPTLPPVASGAPAAPAAPAVPSIPAAPSATPNFSDLLHRKAS